MPSTVDAIEQIVRPDDNSREQSTFHVSKSTCESHHKLRNGEVWVCALLPFHKLLQRVANNPRRERSQLQKKRYPCQSLGLHTLAWANSSLVSMRGEEPWLVSLCASRLLQYAEIFFILSSAPEVLFCVLGDAANEEHSSMYSIRYCSKSLVGGKVSALLFSHLTFLVKLRSVPIASNMSSQPRKQLSLMAQLISNSRQQNGYVR